MDAQLSSARDAGAGSPAAARGRPIDAAARDAVLARELAALRMIESLGEDQFRRCCAADLAAERDAARAAIAPLTHWPACPQAQYRHFLDGANLVRVHRVLQFTLPGDRVMDIGCGRGYLGGVLLRDGKIEAYHGIDIARHLVDCTRQMAQVNGLLDQRVSLDARNLFDLTSEYVAARRPDLLLCLEVLEHLRNPEEAVAVLSAAMPPHAALLLTVPLVGRLENVWDHWSVFGADRLVEMCEATGLTVHTLQPLHNAWALVVASHDSSQPARVRASLQRAAADAPVALGATFAAIDLPDPPTRFDSRWGVRSERIFTRVGEHGILCEVAAGAAAAGGGHYGGIRIPLDEASVVRAELSFSGEIEVVFADAYDEFGDRRARWSWQVTAATQPPAKPTTFVFRSGQRTGAFQPGLAGELSSACELHIFVKLPPRARAALTLHRAAQATPPRVVP
ncbi:bifunctional 3-demethylubiquinone-9 3-methyltransferase/ 2-octaprenyl-6-hydroxy phenol methylase [Phycisphaerae bacterium RAS1]|nr:bifunctional 3-demethylubiquinone-9 3-methyltransferase/ 2-octaprenyl-6-hydroxy phenol methylase [Phycisphaerae bacterium RAS1]